MRKSDKKIENQLRVTLTNVCDIALKEFTGFQWLTHLVNYSDFPKSLKVVCVFDTNDNHSKFLVEKNSQVLSLLIQKKLFESGINIKNMGKHLTYDTEENCEKDHYGNWGDRLV
ncbi:MAG: hypothetical protein ACI9LM_003875 [Alteromonadaceae bacterium]|jgi:hypothetical protein